MYQSGIIPVDQGVYLFNADFLQMIHKFINQLLADTFVLVIEINADGIQARFFLENTAMRANNLWFEKASQTSFHSSPAGKP
jgi:hypothetical protein